MKMRQAFKSLLKLHDIIVNEINFSRAEKEIDENKEL